MRILARELAVPVSTLVLTRGVTSRDKDVARSRRRRATRATSFHASTTARIGNRAHSADSAEAARSHVKHSVSAVIVSARRALFSRTFRVPWNIRVRSLRDATARANVAQTLEIKPFSSIDPDQKVLAVCRWCAIFRADSHRRSRAPTVTTFEEYGKMAKKGGAPTKSEVLTQISKDTGLSRKQVGGVFDSLSAVIKKSLRGNGLFTVPGLMKLKVVKKPATKAREGVEPVHRREDDVQGQAREQEGSRAAAEEPQGHGELRGTRLGSPQDLRAGRAISQRSRRNSCKRRTRIVLARGRVLRFSGDMRGEGWRSRISSSCELR